MRGGGCYEEFGRAGRGGEKRGEEVVFLDLWEAGWDFNSGRKWDDWFFKLMWCFFGKGVGI